MSDEISAIGDATMAGLAARAVEPGHGSAQSHHHARCLNCGNFLSGTYCSGCGQSGHIHRSIGAFWHDLMHGVLHFEGKLWRTLPMLAWRPGDLTRRYINGERARFFSPLALFLFTVFITFAVFNMLGTGEGPAVADAPDRTESRVSARTAVADLDRQIADARIQIAAARAAGRPTGDLEDDVRGMEGARALAGRIAQGAPATDPYDPRTLDFGTGVPMIDQAVAKAQRDPALLFYKLQSNAYKFAWALIPLSAPFLWLMYPFSRRFGLYDHLVFVTYSISFMLILLIIMRLLAAAGITDGPIFAAPVLYAPVHIYRQLRGTYRSSRIGALLRAILLTLFAFVTLFLFMAGLLAMGLFG